MYGDERLAMNEAPEDSFDERDCCYCDGDDCCGDDYDGHYKEDQVKTSALTSVIVLGVLIVGFCATIACMVYVTKLFWKTVSKMANC